MYSPKLGERVLEFAASGWTWHNVVVLQDLETGSLWFTGVGMAGSDAMVCVAGELQDTQLPRLESLRLAWTSWFKGWPHSTVIKVKNP
ncbi:hypothetical protein DRQ50_09530 [bacterium]|nr:MAG: hypothetical protein DRQ50_09530 [bacterium]